MPERTLLASRPVAAEAPIRLLIVDDSIVARTVLARLLGAQRDFAVAGVAANVAEAFALLGRGVVADVILLDLDMPGTDGLTALPELIARSGGARVLIVSSTTAKGAAATVRALTLGAADTLLKPATVEFAGRFADELAERLRRIGRVERAGASSARDWTSRGRRAPLRCLAIGASTGGPHALAAFLNGLGGPVGAPILVTQHLPPPFMPIFAAQLREITGRPVTVATEGARLVADEVLLAPGDAHLTLTGTGAGTGASVRVRLDRRPAASACLPSVDPMFVAVAERYGDGGVGVVLTGMGRDGLAGARALAAAGGEVLAQDAATSVVWGMPGVVSEAGLAAIVAPPAALARRIAEIAGRC